MKKISSIIIFLLSMLVQADTFVCPQYPPSPDMIIDGNLTEGMWKKAAQTGIFTGMNDAKITETAQALYFCDKENIYIGFIANITPGDLTLREKQNDVANLFNSDTVEFMLFPGDNGTMSQIAVNYLGRTWKTGICGPFKFGVQRRPDRWFAEFQIPYTSLRVSESKKFENQWRVNFARGNAPLKEWSSWAKIENSFHEYSKFNTLKNIPAPLKEIQTAQFNASRAPVELIIKRQLYDTQKELSFDFNINMKRSLKNFRLKVTVLNRQKQLVKTKEFKNIYFENKFQLSIDDLKNDRYYLTLSLFDDKNKEVDQQTRSFWKIPPPSKLPENHFTIKDQCGYVNGKFFFPIIIWNWTYGISNKTKIRNDQLLKGADWYYENLDAYLKDIKEHGFNTLFCDGSTYVDQNPNDLRGNIRSWEWFTPWAAKKMGMTWERTVKHVKNHGFYLIPMSPYIQREINDDRIDLFVKQILKYRDCEQVLAWSMSDETDAQVEWNKQRKELYHAIDPNRPVWLNVITALYENCEASDIFCSDPYPIPHSPVTTVASKTDRLLYYTRKNPKQTQWIWLQNFGDEGDWTRPPTAEELQQMTTLALNHGIKGIAYFTYVPKWRRDLGKRQNPKAWEALKTINARTTELAPMYCLGKRLMLKRQDALDVCVISYEGYIYVSVVNVTNKACKGVITLPPTAKVQSGEVLYENRKIIVEQQKIIENFPACAVRIYRFPAK